MAIGGSLVGVNQSRAAADDESPAGAVEAASAIFLTGGNQLRLTTIVLGTRLRTAIVAAHRGGAVVEAVGRGVVTVVDGSWAETNVWAARRAGPLLVSGAVLPTLPGGARLDLRERQLCPGDAPRRAAAVAAASDGGPAPGTRGRRRRARR